MTYKKIIIFACIISGCFAFQVNAREDTLSVNEQLFSAVKNNEKEAALILLKKGADPDALNNFGFSSMGYAVMTDKTGIVRILLEHGGDADSETTMPTFDRGMKVLRQFPLLLLAVQKKNLEMASLLLDHGADVDAQGHKGATALIIAVNLDRRDMVGLLLSKGADINAQMDDGKTALMWAVLHRNKDMVSLLISLGADPSIADKRGSNAVQYAKQKEDKNIIKQVEDAPVRNVITGTREEVAEKPAKNRRVIVYNGIIFLLIIGLLSFFYFKK